MTLESEILSFAWRHMHILSVHAELVRVGRNKAFLPYHAPMWNMLLSERDMVIVDVASWVKAFCSESGFLRSLQASDLIALSLPWIAESGDRGATSSPGDPVAIETPSEWRRSAFERLFRGAADAPSPEDIAKLCGRLGADFAPLRLDRNQHRAHKYERDKKITVAAAWLVPADVTPYLVRCQRLLRDLRCLSSNSDFAHPELRPDPDEDEARDVVDLVLCGTISWIWRYGPGADTTPEHESVLAEAGVLLRAPPRRA